MNSKPVIKTYILLIGFGLILAMMNNSKNKIFNLRINSDNLEYNNSTRLDKKKSRIITLSEQIHINNNWSVAKAAGICKGEGTYSDPFIIENLILEAMGTRACILIENSNVYFKIKNCTTFSSNEYSFGYGIRLNYVTNSILISNNCSSQEFGIILYNCKYNTIFGNVITNNQHCGISLGNSDYNNITENLIKNNNEGIGLMSTSDGKNQMYCSDQNNISKNIIINNINGIVIETGNYNNVSENIINDNHEDGLKILSGYKNNVSKNNINNNGLNGIYFSNCLYNNLLENTIRNNYRGIYLSQSDFNNIIGNKLSGNDKCWEEYDCNGNIFLNNDCGSEPVILGYNLFLVFNFLIIISFIIRGRKSIKFN